MAGKRRKNTKNSIINKILMIKKMDQFNQQKPKDIRSILLKTHKASLVPSERVIYNIIKKNKDKLNFDSIDDRWTLASLDTYPVPAEALPKILSIWINLLERGFLITNRMVKWISRLYALTDNLETLIDLSTSYCVAEVIKEISNNHTLNAPGKIVKLLNLITEKSYDSEKLTKLLEEAKLGSFIYSNIADSFYEQEIIPYREYRNNERE